MYQNVKWLRFILFTISYVSIAVIIFLMDIPGLSLWMGSVIALLWNPLRRWFGFHIKSETSTNSLQTASVRSQEEAKTNEIILLACVFFIGGLLHILLHYNIIPQGPLFSMPL